MIGPVRNRVDRAGMLRLASELLELAAETFSNHGCNDFERPGYMTEEEWTMIAEDYEQWNSNGEDDRTDMGDFSLMTWLSILLREGKL